MKTVFLSPEPPYPLHGGGAYRTASLIHYFAAFGPVDLILISATGQPALLPPGLVRKQHVIPLKRNSRTLAARILRNAGRAIRGVPPLSDRMSGLGVEISAALAAERYDFGIIEHFWCAGYLPELAAACHSTILDLHNIESILHRRSAALGPLPVRAGHLRFASAARRSESLLLPRFSRTLVTSEADAATAAAIAPTANLTIYPNSFPLLSPPSQTTERIVVFSANFEYHPNIDAVRFLIGSIWPVIRRSHPAHRLLLVGRGEKHIRHLLPDNHFEDGIECTGPVETSFHEIARAEVVIAPLRTGSGTRLKIIEAWAAARPVVATTLAAEGLRAVHNQNLILADTPDEFSAAVCSLLDNPLEALRLSAAGRETYENYYTWNNSWNILDVALHLSRTPGLAGYTEIA